MSRARCPAALARAFRFDTKALAEEMIRGREIECSVLGDEVDALASLPGEIVVRHPDGFYSHEATYIDEVNTIPGFTAISMYPKFWEASGVKATELVSRLIDLALARHAARGALSTTR